MTWRRAAVALSIALLAASCGGGESGPPTGPNPPANTFRVTIGGTGVVSPAELVVPPGTRVLFTNNHTVPHDMTSDPHPEHDDCTEINQVGLLQPGQSRETGNFVMPKSCGFHDHNDFMNRSLQGRIVIR